MGSTVKTPLDNALVTDANRLAIIVIAAGSSSRLGQAKQLVRFQNETLLNKANRIANSISKSVVCVIGFEHERLQEHNQPAVTNFIVNQNWQIGMGSSIAAGVKYFSQHSNRKNIEAVLILLCDQYLLTETDLKKLYSQWTMNKAQIIASQYFDRKKQQEVLGAPAIFPKKYFKDLLGLTNKGARNLLHQYRNNVIAVDLKNAATDLDTKDDLQQLKALDDLNTENNND